MQRRALSCELKGRFNTQYACVYVCVRIHSMVKEESKRQGRDKEKTTCDVASYKGLSL